MSPRSDPVEAGGRIAPGAERRDLLRRLVLYGDTILTGAQPADRPVEHPTAGERIITHDGRQCAARAC